MKLNIRELRDRASGLAAQNREPLKKLLLIYCGVIAVLTLGVPALDLFLSDQIGTTGGLAGMRLRTVLQTIREILNLVNQFFGYFWSAGFVIAMMAMVLGREPQTRDLTGGFRRFFRVLGHIAFEFLFVVILMAAAVNLAAMLFSMSPQGGALVRELTAITSNPNLLTPEGLLNVDLIPMDLLAAIALPMTIITIVIFLPLYIWLSYGFRLSLYLLLDGTVPSAFQARFVSMRLMRGHKWSMLKLDLSFWWYYLLVTVITAVGYLDVILSLAGIPLPMDETVMFFATIAAYCVLITALSLWKKAQVEASYVLAYEAIAHPEPVEITE
jgi:hypothetical protein